MCFDTENIRLILLKCSPASGKCQNVNNISTMLLMSQSRGPETRELNSGTVNRIPLMTQI